MAELKTLLRKQLFTGKRHYRSIFKLVLGTAIRMCWLIGRLRYSYQSICVDGSGGHHIDVWHGNGIFRFINKQPESERRSQYYFDERRHYVHNFSIVCIVFGQSINALGYGEHPEFIWMLGVVVSMDA